MYHKNKHPFVQSIIVFGHSQCLYNIILHIHSLGKATASLTRSSPTSRKGGGGGKCFLLMKYFFIIRSQSRTIVPASEKSVSKRVI